MGFSPPFKKIPTATGGNIYTRFAFSVVRPSLPLWQTLFSLKGWTDSHCLLGRSEAEAHAVVAVVRVVGAAVRRPAIPRIAAPATAAAHAARPI